MKPTQEQITKLPKWAQEYISDLERERLVSLRALNESIDEQTPSPFYYEDLISSGEQTGPSVKRFNIQTHCVYVDYEGVKLQIIIRAGQPGINMQWVASGCMISEVAFVPVGHQSARLVSKENMH